MTNKKSGIEIVSMAFAELIREINGEPACWCENMPVGGLEFAKEEIKAVFSADLNFCPQCGKKL